MRYCLTLVCGFISSTLVHSSSFQGNIEYADDSQNRLDASDSDVYNSPRGRESKPRGAENNVVRDRPALRRSRNGSNSFDTQFEPPATTQRNSRVKFLLFTQVNNTQPEVLNTDNLKLNTTSFDPRLETKFIVAGYLQKPSPQNIYYGIKDTLLDALRCNVIMVDWSDLSVPPYSRAVKNAKMTGDQIAKLVHQLQIQTGICPPSVHIIGHDLGAHVAGFAGEKIANLGRITGLDPSGYLFYNAPRDDRLDTTDALLVDIIHTNGGNKRGEGFGIMDTIGHVDFYPNGGRRQPACNSEQTAKWVSHPFLVLENDSDHFMRENICHHGMALAYFLTSISKTSCCFIGIVCHDWDSYNKGKCHSKKIPPLQVEMGLNTDRFDFAAWTGNSTLKVYLKTSKQIPFCNSS